MKNRPTAIFVESNTSGSGAEFLQRALELGLVPIFLTATTDRYPFLQDLDSIETHICDTSSIAAVSRCIDAVNAENSIALIMSSSDHYLDMAALQASRLGLCDC